MATTDSTCKTCTKCFCSSALACFSINKHGKYGRDSVCKPCRRSQALEYRNRPGYKKRHALANKACTDRKRALKEVPKGWIPFRERTTRKCGTCNTVKPLCDFGNDKRGIFGKGHRCMPCVRSLSAKWYAENKQRALKANASWRARNIDKVRSYSVAYSLRQKDNSGLRLKNRIRTAVGRSLRAGSPVGAFRFLPYDINELANHLERQFVSGMSWENYGKWHVDHIVPLASFGELIVGTRDFGRAWGLTNLRPLWAHENCRKSKTVTHLI